jgi:hypothetical protein
MLHTYMCASEPASGSLSVRTQSGHRKRSIQSPEPLDRTDDRDKDGIACEKL